MDVHTCSPVSDDLRYEICCSQVEVHGKALVGYPLLALPTVQFTEASACTWQWFRSSTAVASPRSRKPVTEWLPVLADGPRYVPTAADEGCMLRVTCRPPPAKSDTVRGTLGWRASRHTLQSSFVQGTPPQHGLDKLQCLHRR